MGFLGPGIVISCIYRAIPKLKLMAAPGSKGRTKKGRDRTRRKEGETKDDGHRYKNENPLTLASAARLADDHKMPTNPSPLSISAINRQHQHPAAPNSQPHSS